VIAKSCMKKNLETYKKFIDELVDYHGSVSFIKDQFIKKKWKFAAAKKLSSLPDDTRCAILEVMAEVAETATHDVLVYLTDKQYSIVSKQGPLPERPFHQTLYEDFISRLLKIPWPE
jgi:hypothetical protein